MANQLKVAAIHAIIGLLEQGWSYRRIARELGVHRDTVARYDRLRRLANSKPAKATAGSDSEENPKPAKATAGSDSEENPKPANPTAGSGSGDNLKPANVTLGSGYFPIPDRSLGPPSLCQRNRPAVTCADLRSVFRNRGILGWGIFEWDQVAVAD